MICEDYLMNEKSLCIFTDGGVHNVQGIPISTSGSIVIYNYHVVSENLRVLKNSTNNIGELVGVYDGIQQGLLLAQQNSRIKNIYLFSDSKFCIEGLTGWLTNWVTHKTNENVLRSPYGKEVANQHIFQAIVNLVAYFPYELKEFYLVKIRGHMKEPTDIHPTIDLNRQIDYIFNNNYGIFSENKLNHKAGKLIIGCNNMIDQLVSASFDINKIDIDNIPEAYQVLPINFQDINKETMITFFDKISYMSLRR
ncbi:MAG: hypothetical protein PHC62_00815 [Candidatus Izemoplasmatales bacterium]|nr:hypothetical protein [Candidatus Izemoplasmatales bacterium]